MKAQFDALQLASYLDAINFSYLMHKGQCRRDLAIPYWVHPSFVSATVAEWGGDVEQIIAALTHDVIEDTDIDNVGFAAVMGEDVQQIVAGVSGTKDPALSWRARKLVYIQPFVHEAIDPRCYLVKLADVYCNFMSFINTALRREPTAKVDTINSYIVLVQICLDKLRKFGTPEQERLAQFHISQAIQSASSLGLARGAELLYTNEGVVRLSVPAEEALNELIALWKL